jgi:hypothetical protein
LPSPILISTRLWKITQALSVIIFRPCQGLSGSVHLTHSHLALRGRPYNLRPLTPFHRTIYQLW